jgi:hypothetical protein
MKKLILLLACLITSVFAQASKEKRETARDVFAELDEGKLTLRFFDALTGEPISKAKVTLSGVGKFQTDFEGKLLFEVPGLGLDEQFVAKFEKKGYITSHLKVTVLAGSIWFNRFSISPVLKVGQLRVVLDWGDEPNDLDAHLVKEGSYHISFRDMKTSEDGKAILDRDDWMEYGPETITTEFIDPRSNYEYYVHNYSERGESGDESLSKSRARVLVYEGERLLHQFKVPEGQGTIWKVFEINQKQLLKINKLEK